MTKTLALAFWTILILTVVVLSLPPLPSFPEFPQQITGVLG